MNIDHIADNAQMRNGYGEWGDAKLWTERNNGKWIVDLP